MIICNNRLFRTRIFCIFLKNLGIHEILLILRVSQFQHEPFFEASQLNDKALNQFPIRMRGKSLRKPKLCDSLTGRNAARQHERRQYASPDKAGGHNMAAVVFVYPSMTVISALWTHLLGVRRPHRPAASGGRRSDGLVASADTIWRRGRYLNFIIITEP